MAQFSTTTEDGKKTVLYRYFTENIDLSDTEYLPPTKFAVGVNNPDVSTTDNELTTPVPITSGTVNDDGSNTLTGSDGGENSTDNTDTFKPGAGQIDDTSQNLIANDTSITKTWTISDVSSSGNSLVPSKYTGFWIYIKDSATLSKFLDSGTAIEGKIGNDSSNYYSITSEAEDLSTGWNWISTKNELLSDQPETGSPSSPLNYFSITITTNAATDEFSAGDVLFDLLRQWDSNDVYKDFVSGYPSIDFGKKEVTTRVYISAVQMNGFDFNSLGIFNQDADRLMTDVHKFTPESKSNTDEFTFIIRNRIL